MLVFVSKAKEVFVILIRLQLFISDTFVHLNSLIRFNMRLFYTKTRLISLLINALALNSAVKEAFWRVVFTV